jgi:hypothetical protein
MMKKKKRKQGDRMTWRDIWGGILFDFLGGTLLEGFIIRHTKMIFAIVIVLFLYISNRYVCINQVREIDRLQVQLREIKSEAMSKSIQLTEYTRPSRVEELVKGMGLKLEKAKTPPYVIHSKK